MTCATDMVRRAASTPDGSLVSDAAFSHASQTDVIMGVRGCYPNNSMIGLPVVKVREMPLASWGLLMGMSRAW